MLRRRSQLHIRGIVEPQAPTEQDWLSTDFN